MFNRKRSYGIAAAVLIAALLAGCGVLPGGDDDKDDAIVVGTTSAPSVLDPAGAWDGSWELFRNVYQTLMHFPNSSTAPEPDAARRCEFTDANSSVFRCTLRPELEFSNGRPLDARAVKFSFERVLRINAKTGPAPLLDGLDRIETPDERTVVFHLKRPDATFPLILATPATALVDPGAYPADRLRTGAELVGSGPFALESFTSGREAVLTGNTSYQGPADIRNSAVTIRYFKKSQTMVRALEKSEIDVIYRGLTPRQITGLQNSGASGDDDLDLKEIAGTEIRYLVFNPQHAPADKPAVRQAVAQLIDRKALVRKVYERTAEPLYSMVPSGITGHTNAFYDLYGEPSRKEARRLLRDAGIEQPVELTLWYATDRYGATAEGEFREIERQLEDSGLFDITVEGREWNEFQASYTKGEYPAFGRGWFPDFPDADNYISPFVGEKNALGAPYENATVTEDLLPRSRKESDRGVAAQVFGRTQRVLAEDSRLLPLWQGKVYVASHQEIAGVERCLDPSTIMQMWELHRKASW